MLRDEDVPEIVQVRCGESNAHRYDTIQQAAEYYGCNKSDAIVRACDDVPSLVSAARKVLQRDDLTAAQRREIAETFNDARGVEFDVDATLKVEKDP